MFTFNYGLSYVWDKQENERIQKSKIRKENAVNSDIGKENERVYNIKNHLGGATININHISKQQKTQEEEKNSYHFHYI